MATKRKQKSEPTTIDEYLATVSSDKRVALESLRKIIRAAVPRAEECISYHLPGFRLDGKGLVWFGASANHCAIYGLEEVDPGDLADYGTSGRGTIRFQVDHPLPATLVRKLVKAKISKVSKIEQKISKRTKTTTTAAPARPAAGRRSSRR